MYNLSIWRHMYTGLLMSGLLATESHVRHPKRRSALASGLSLVHLQVRISHGCSSRAFTSSYQPAFHSHAMRSMKEWSLAKLR